MTPAEARTNLAATLKTELPDDVKVLAPVYLRQPSRVTPPCVILAPADPWIDTQGLPYGSAWYRYTGRAIVPNGTLEAIADDLDELVGSVIAVALSAPGEWHLDNVSAPDIVILNDQPYQFADIALSAPFTL